MKNQCSKLILIVVLTFTYLGCSSSDDSPEPISCQNGGTSVNGGCDCPPGFDGIDCSTQLTPRSVVITNVIVRAFPNLQSDGSFWDLALPNAEDALPDIYVTIQDSDLDVIYDSPTFFENAIANGSNTFDFTPNSSIIITDFDNPFLVNIWDFDTTSDDDFMTSEGFFIFREVDGFPETITIVDQLDEILVDLELRYNF